MTNSFQKTFYEIVDTSLLNNIARSYPLQSPDQTSIVHGVSTVAAPTTRLRTQSFYNPSMLISYFSTKT